MARGRSDSGRMESDSGVRLPQLHGRFVGTERRRRLAQARRPQMARCWKMTSLRQALKQEEVGKVAVSHSPMAGLARGACLIGGVGKGSMSHQRDTIRVGRIGYGFSVRR